MTDGAHEPSLELNARREIDGVCLEFEDAWQAENRPNIAPRLVRVDKPLQSHLLRELLRIDVERRIDLGDCPAVEDYLPHFADHRDVIESELSTNAPSWTEFGSTVDGEFEEDTSEDRTPRSSTTPIRWPRIPGYEVISEIGRGAMGAVYKARHISLDRLVALKVILSGDVASPEEVSRFQTEARAAAALDHPGIVPLYEVGESEGRHFYAMGFVEGRSLKEHLVDGLLEPRAAAALVRKLAEAMACACERGVVHRDLKPANVLMDESGEPRITDFGLAKLVSNDDELTQTGQILGTPAYMAPEQAAGATDRIDARADVYALGAILYCLVTGRPPFQAATVMETLLQVREQDPLSPRQLNPSVPRDLETICLKCLEKDPDRRYASAVALGDDLTAFLDGRPIVARPIGRIGRVWRWCNRNSLVATLVSTVVLLLVSGTVVSTHFGLRATSEKDRANKSAAAARDESKKNLDLRIVAERQRREIEGSQRETNRQLRRVRTILSESEFKTALDFEDDGAGTESLHWLARAMTSAPPDSAEMTRIRAHLLTGLERTPRTVAILPHEGAVHFAFSPDGAVVATAGIDEAVKIWNTSDGAFVREFAFEVHADERTRNRYSLRGWPEYVGSFRRIPRLVRSLSIDGSGKYVALLTIDSKLRVWSRDSGEAVDLPIPPGTGVVSATFLPRTSRLLVRCDDDALRQLNVRTAQFVGPEIAIEPKSRLVVSPNGGFVALFEEVGQHFSNNVVVRSLETGEVCFGPFDNGLSRSIRSVRFVPSSSAFSPETGRIVLLINGIGSTPLEAVQFDLTTGKVLDRTPAEFGYKRYSESNDTIRGDGGAFLGPVGDLHSVAERKRLTKVQYPRGFHPQIRTEWHTFGPDNRVSAALSFRIGVGRPATTRLRFIDSDTGSTIGREATIAGKIDSGVHFSPDGGQVIVGSVDTEPRIIAVPVIHPPFMHFAGTGVAQNDDGTQLITVHGTDGSLWNTTEPLRMPARVAHDSAITGVEFGSTGERLATRDAAGTVKLWDTSNWRAIRTLDSRSAGAVKCVFDTAGARLAITDGDRVVVLDCRNVDAAPFVITRPKPVRRVGWLADGRTLYTIESTDRAGLEIMFGGRVVEEPDEVMRETLCLHELDQSRNAPSWTVEDVHWCLSTRDRGKLLTVDRRFQVRLWHRDRDEYSQVGSTLLPKLGRITRTELGGQRHEYDRSGRCPVRFCANGQSFVVLGVDAIVYDATTCEPRMEAVPQAIPPTACLSRDGRYLATIADATGKLMGLIPEHSSRRRLLVWDTRTGELAAECKLRNQGGLTRPDPAYMMEFTPNGEHLLVGGGADHAVQAIRTEDWASEPKPVTYSGNLVVMNSNRNGRVLCVNHRSEVVIGDLHSGCTVVGPMKCSYEGVMYLKVNRVQTAGLAGNLAVVLDRRGRMWHIPVPAPLVSTPEEAVTLVESATGHELTEDRLLNRLETNEWRRRLDTTRLGVGSTYRIRWHFGEANLALADWDWDRTEFHVSRLAQLGKTGNTAARIMRSEYVSLLSSIIDDVKSPTEFEQQEKSRELDVDELKRRVSSILREDEAASGSSSIVGNLPGEARAFGGRIDFCWCPPGIFHMGSLPSEPHRRDNENQSTVTLTRGFWLSRTEVTQGQWEDVMGTRPWEARGMTDSEGYRAGENFPAVYVTWDEASEFCGKLTERERHAGRLPEGFSFRLPTEAQWEYACRAGTSTRWSFGDQFDEEFVWYVGNADGHIHEVGTRKANLWGLCDMHGNVKEWCADLYDDSLGGGRDPIANTNGPNHTSRGGDILSRNVDCRSASRGGWLPKSGHRNVLGFRIAAVLTDNTG